MQYDAAFRYMITSFFPLPQGENYIHLGYKMENRFIGKF